jgi:pyruvate/2-oxoglutarate dehydrogenase complex dihydrolipoamide acyltransferase (E2) component
MGVAVAVEDGLIVPVVRDVDQLSISGLNRAIAEVAARARAASSSWTTTAAARSRSTTPAGSART